MRVLSPARVGTRTDEYEATFAFFRDVLGLGVHSLETDFACSRSPTARPWRCSDRRARTTGI